MFVTTATSRRELQEGAVGLVRLDHGPLASAPRGVRARRAQLAADQERRVAAGLEQGERHHRGGRRLPVRAAHGDRPLHPRQLASRSAAVQDPRARRPGGRQLRVVLGDRRGDHHLRALRQVRGVVADRPARSRPRAAARSRTTRPGRSRSRSRRAAARRARARSSPRRRCPTKCSRRPSNGRRLIRARSTSSATRSAASGLATARAAFDISAIRCGAAEQAAHLARQPRTVQLGVRDHDRRAGLAP